MGFFAVLSTILTFTLQLCLVRSRPAQRTASSRPISLQLPNGNLTQTFPQIGPYANWAGSRVHVETIYVIPHTDITLSILDDPNVPLAPPAVAACLEEVIEYADSQLPDIPLHEPFRLYYSEEATFVISPTSYIYDLHWKDVVTVTRGLLDYLQISHQWKSSMVVIADAERGSFGSCSIQNAGARRRLSPHHVNSSETVSSSR